MHYQQTTTFLMPSGSQMAVVRSQLQVTLFRPGAQNSPMKINAAKHQRNI